MVNKNKIPTTIINSILEDIMQGRLVPGQAMPSQNELCLEYNTSRGSIGEALKALELAGILKIKPGIDAFVKTLLINSLFIPAKIPNVMIDSYNYHKKIFISIKNKNNVEAVKNVKEHLEFVKKDFKITSVEEKSTDEYLGMLADNIK